MQAIGKEVLFRPADPRIGPAGQAKQGLHRVRRAKMTESVRSEARPPLLPAARLAVGPPQWTHKKSRQAEVLAGFDDGIALEASANC